MQCIDMMKCVYNSPNSSFRYITLKLLPKQLEKGSVFSSIHMYNIGVTSKWVGNSCSSSQMAAGKVAAICSHLPVVKLILCPNYCFIHLNMHRQSY